MSMFLRWKGEKMSNGYNFTFYPAKSQENKFCRNLRYTRANITGKKLYGIGLDPGVNFGVVFLRGTHADIYHGALVKQTEPGMYGVVAYKFIHEFILNSDVGRMVIEGAAYGAKFRQVLLAEVRAGYFIGAFMRGVRPIIVPPPTIRKKVFGDGKTQAGEEWPQLNHNAADALSMAIYASII